MINDQELEFLAKRKKMVRAWPFAGMLLIVVIIVFLIGIYFRAPLLINPYALLARLGAKNIAQSTLVLLAGMLPIAFLTVFFLLLVIVLYMFAFISREKKYIQIIEALLEQQKKTTLD
jgi:hypothetical protein